MGQMSGGRGANVLRCGAPLYRRGPTRRQMTTTERRRRDAGRRRPSVRRSFNISSSATAPAMVYRRNFAQARARVIERPAGRNEKPETIVISESDAAAAAAS